MSRRTSLPQTEGGVCLTDAGMETGRSVSDGIDLPAYASCPLVEDEAGREGGDDDSKPGRKLGGGAGEIGRGHGEKP